jgi:hypothetical protein
MAGAMIRMTIRTWARSIAILAFLWPQMATAAAVGTSPVDRAVEFFRNVYTGVEMKPEEWLTKATREAPLFTGFGGLKTMVRQSTEKAAASGGFKAAKVRKSTRTPSGYEATIEVIFNDPSKGRNESAAATMEDEIWNVKIVKEGGSWKIAL